MPEPGRSEFRRGLKPISDEKGESRGHFDVHDYIGLCRAHYEKNRSGRRRR